MNTVEAIYDDMVQFVSNYNLLPDEDLSYLLFDNAIDYEALFTLLGYDFDELGQLCLDGFEEGVVLDETKEGVVRGVFEACQDKIMSYRDAIKGVEGDE